jgi:hypothetical protein
LSRRAGLATIAGWDARLRCDCATQPYQAIAEQRRDRERAHPRPLDALDDAHFTALERLTEPTPMIDVEMTCVVETGTPSDDAPW